MDSNTNPLKAYFDANPGRLINKWAHYFDVYHRHFARFRGQKCTLLEVGIFHGGSLQMWRDYLGPQARIVGVDINPRVSELAAENVEIHIGDQGNPAFIAELAKKVGAIDILIDDGGHQMVQQINTLLGLYDTVSADGVILVEDTHTSYWREYGGGLRATQSFMEFAKQLVDELNAWHSRDPQSFSPGRFTQSTRSMHFYDSIVVIEKGAHPQPQEVTSGTPSFDIGRPVNE